MLCGACLRAARTPPPSAAGPLAGQRAARWVWDSVLFRDALARLDPGAAMAIFRAAAGLSQLQLAQILGCSQTTIWRLEAGERKSLYDIRELLRFAGTVGMPRRALLPLILGPDEGGSALAGQPAMGDAESWSVEAVVSGQVGVAGTGYLRACAGRLWAQGLVTGGGSVRDQALGLWQQACRQLDEGKYGDHAGLELMHAAGELAVLGGWACHDSDQPDLARRLYADGLIRAGHAGDDRGSAHALVNQALLFTELARPGLVRQAIWLTGQAAGQARRDPSARLHALIAAREAIARAGAGDRGGFDTAIARARREMDRETSDGDPAWLQPVTPAAVTAHEAHGEALLGNDDGAVVLYREILHDPGIPLRDAAVWRARLAFVLAGRGDIGQAASDADVVLDLLEGPVASGLALAVLRPVRAAAGQAGLTGFCARFDTVAAPSRDGAARERHLALARSD